jgi:hypothetical protein
MYSCGGALGNQDISYAAIHQRLSAKVAGYSDKFNQFVVDYAVEWDKVVTTRVSNGIKTTEGLRRDLDHYQKKVEELRTMSNKILSKGKMVDDKTQEKLKRNEEKYIAAKEIYDKAARDMCMLLDETTGRAWKDLHPILVKMAQFDMTLSNDEAKGLADMESVVIALKALASKEDLKASGRLKELGSQEPSMLFTGSGVGTVAALTNGEISSGIEGLSLSSYGESTNSLPPGSVAPQGMGGFPVQIQSNDEPNLAPLPVASSRRDLALTTSAPSSGNASWHNSSNMTTSEMLGYASSAAPPPTMDQVSAGFQRQSSQQSLSSYGSNNYVSSPIAPPPMAAPPPPPPVTPTHSNHYGGSPNGGQMNPPTSWGSPPPQPMYSPQPLTPSYGAPPSMYGGSSTNPFDPPGGGGNTNPFDPPAGGGRVDPPSNPFAY